MNIKSFLEEYWNKLTIKKWDYLYKANNNDTNLYYVVSWKIILSINWENIAIVWENEINGEKSFLENKPKPIDAIAKENVSLLVLSREQFEKISNEKKISFLKELVLLISNRVYLLNDIITNLSYMNTSVIEAKPTGDLSCFKRMFSFMDLKNIYIYKILDKNTIISIYESKYDIKIQEKIKENINESFIIKNENKNTIMLNIWWYILLFEVWDISNYYVVNNILMHSIGILKYLCIILEQRKNNDLYDLLN